MATRKEERDRRRAERVEAERAAAVAERRRLTLGYVVAGVLTAAVVVGIVIAVTSGGGGGSKEEDRKVGGQTIPAAAHVQLDSGSVEGLKLDDREGAEPPDLAQGDLELAAEEAGCELALDLTDEGNGHLTPGDDPPDYETTPPTSGDHDPTPQADGAYLEAPEERNYVHAMEHGRVLIHYSPKLPEREQLELKGVFDEDPDGMLLIPNADMPYEVATTAWTQLMTCKRYEGAATLDAIRDFRDVYRGQAPEDVPITLEQ